MRVSTLLVGVPVVALAAVVALANRTEVTFSLEPFSEDPAFAISLPLFLLVFLTFFLGVLLGGLTVWWRRAGPPRSSNLPDIAKPE